MNEEIRKRDALWCQALVATLDTVQIEKVTAEFNRLRNEAVEQTLAPDGACENCGNVGRINRSDIEQCDACGYPSPTDKA